MVREATAEDVTRLVDIIAEFHAASPFWSQWDYEPSAVERLCANMISSDDGTIFMGDTGSFGMFAIAPIPFSDHLRTCLEIGLYGKGEALAIIRMACEWGKRQGAHVLPMAAHHGMKSADKLYQRMGFVPLETLYAKVL